MCAVKEATMMLRTVIPVSADAGNSGMTKCRRNRWERWGVAVILIGIFAAIALPKIPCSVERSKNGAASGDIGAFNSALALYRVDVSDALFPGTLGQLLTDTAPGWSGPYVATITRDPWGNDYAYTSNGSDYTICSVHDAQNDQAETIRYIASLGAMEYIPPVRRYERYNIVAIAVAVVLLLLGALTAWKLRNAEGMRHYFWAATAAVVLLLLMLLVFVLVPVMLVAV